MVDTFNINILSKGVYSDAASPRAVPIWQDYTFYRTSSVPAFNKSNIIGQFRSVIETPLLALLSVNYSRLETDIRSWDDATDPFLADVATAPGSVSGDSLPSYATVSMTLKSDIRGHSSHGGKRFGGIAESKTLANELTDAAYADWVAWAVTLAAGFTDSAGNLWLPGVLSKKNSQTQRNPTLCIVYGVDTVIVKQPLTIMRRRGALYRRP